MKIKLPKQFKDKWVKALRSGKYKQGKGVLHRNGRYCCLGVACAVSGMSHVPRGLTIHSKLSKYDSVPVAIRGGCSDNSKVSTLVEMNDTRGKNFNQIADWIEKHL